MPVHLVSQTLFNLPRMAEYEASPYITKQGDHQGDCDNYHTLLKQERSHFRGLRNEKVYRFFYDERDKEEKKIYQEEAQESNAERPAILDKVYTKGLEIFHHCSEGGGENLFCSGTRIHSVTI